MDGLQRRHAQPQRLALPRCPCAKAPSRRAWLVRRKRRFGSDAGNEMALPGTVADRSVFTNQSRDEVRQPVSERRWATIGCDVPFRGAPAEALPCVVGSRRHLHC